MHNFGNVCYPSVTLSICFRWQHNDMDDKGNDGKNLGDTGTDDKDMGHRGNEGKGMDDKDNEDAGKDGIDMDDVHMQGKGIDNKGMAGSDLNECMEYIETVNKAFRTEEEAYMFYVGYARKKRVWC